MKKLMIALLACAFALCVALVGCAGGSGSSNASAAWIGTWDLNEMDDNGEVTSSDDIATLKGLGLDVYVAINEDGTASFVLFGEQKDGTWELKDAASATLVLNNQSIDMAMEDGKLKMIQDGSVLTFVKGEARTSSSSASASS